MTNRPYFIRPYGTTRQWVKGEKTGCTIQIEYPANSSLTIENAAGKIQIDRPDLAFNLALEMIKGLDDDRLLTSDQVKELQKFINNLPRELK